jgi:hypothetical protein
MIATNSLTMIHERSCSTYASLEDDERDCVRRQQTGGAGSIGQDVLPGNKPSASVAPVASNVPIEQSIEFGPVQVGHSSAIVAMTDLPMLSLMILICLPQRSDFWLSGPQRAGATRASARMPRVQQELRADKWRRSCRSRRARCARARDPVLGEERRNTTRVGLLLILGRSRRRRAGDGVAGDRAGKNSHDYDEEFGGEHGRETGMAY